MNTTIKEVLYSYKECVDLSEFERLDDTLYGYLNQNNERNDEVFDLCKKISDNIEKYACSKEFVCFLLSVMMRLKKDVAWTNRYLSTVLNGDFGADNWYYVWNQFKRLSLKKMVEMNEESRQMLDEMYQRSYQLFAGKLLQRTEKIPMDQRDEDCVVVLSIQLLGMYHAPTKTLSERVKWLKKLGKKVYIINTTEQYLSAGRVPLYDSAKGSIEESYRNAHTICFDEEESFDFLQLSEKMSIERKFRNALRVIQKLKPYYILSMGTGSMLADLLGNVIPTAGMALAFSTLPHTMNKMRILGRNLRAGEKELYKDIDVIESRFTFELQKQTHTFSRKEYEIPKDRFVLVVIGIRLDYEVDEAFAKLLCRACDDGCFVVFAGKFETYTDLTERYELLRQYSKFIGYCEDIQALMEICDLYVNPVRLGGGFSVIEAFAKGVPGVYTKNGDVYVSGGEDFAVDDIEEMYQAINRYCEDKAYYQEMAQKARKRAELMTSSEDAIREIDDQICNRVRTTYW